MNLLIFLLVFYNIYLIEENSALELDLQPNFSSNQSLINRHADINNLKKLYRISGDDDDDEPVKPTKRVKPVKKKHSDLLFEEIQPYRKEIKLLCSILNKHLNPSKDAKILNFKETEENESNIITNIFPAVAKVVGKIPIVNKVVEIALPKTPLFPNITRFHKNLPIIGNAIEFARNEVKKRLNIVGDLSAGIRDIITQSFIKHNVMGTITALVNTITAAYEGAKLMVPGFGMQFKVLEEGFKIVGRIYNMISKITYNPPSTRSFNSGSKNILAIGPRSLDCITQYTIIDRYFKNLNAVIPKTNSNQKIIIGQLKELPNFTDSNSEVKNEILKTRKIIRKKFGIKNNDYIQGLKIVFERAVGKKNPGHAVQQKVDELLHIYNDVSKESLNIEISGAVLEEAILLIAQIISAIKEAKVVDNNK